MSRLKSDLVLSVLLRVGSGFLALVSTRQLVATLGVDSYGAWAALYSLMGWLVTFDFGMGNSLKNYIATGRNVDEEPNIIAGVFQMFIIASLLIFIAMILFLDRLEIFKQFPLETFTLYLPMALYFPFMVGTFVLQGKRKIPIVVGLGFGQQIIWLITVYVFSQTYISLESLAIANVIITVLCIGTIFIIANFQASCRIAHFVNLNNLLKAIPLFANSLKFLILQCANIVLFSMGTYYAFLYFPLSDVATYDLVNKIGQFAIMGFGIIISVYWGEIAKHVGVDNNMAIKNNLTQILIIAGITALILLIFTFLVMSHFLNWYSHGKVKIDQLTTFCFLILWVAQIFSNSIAVFFNVKEKLNGQIIFYVAGVVLLIIFIRPIVGLGFGIGTIPILITASMLPLLAYLCYSITDIVNSRAVA